MASDEIKIWAMDASGGATPLALAQHTETEQKLEDVLVVNPEMLLPGLTLVGRQTRTEGGPLDLLGVDEDGRLVVFELKRGALNRDAVAQVIDYASSLESMDEAELVRRISGRANAIAGIDDFEQWYDRQYGQDGQELSSLKPVRMVLVGLGVDDATARMVRFLADRDVDISLLTFHGYTYDGKTLLARQMQVAAPAEPKLNSSTKGLGRRNIRERLTQHIDQHTVERPETRELWNAMLGMFHKNFQGLIERPIRGGSELAKHRLRLRMRRGRSLAAIQLGPFGPHPGLVSAIFFPEAVGLCPKEFNELRRDIPSYLTWPRNSPERETRAIEIEFPFNSLAEWEKHKDKLASVTHSINKAYYSSEDDAAEDDE